MIGATGGAALNGGEFADAAIYNQYLEATDMEEPESVPSQVVRPLPQSTQQPEVEAGWIRSSLAESMCRWSGSEHGDFTATDLSMLFQELDRLIRFSEAGGKRD